MCGIRISQQQFSTRCYYMWMHACNGCKPLFLCRCAYCINCANVSILKYKTVAMDDMTSVTTSIDDPRMSQMHFFILAVFISWRCRCPTFAVLRMRN